MARDSRAPVPVRLRPVSSSQEPDPKIYETPATAGPSTVRLFGELIAHPMGMEHFKRMHPIAEQIQKVVLGAADFFDIPGLGRRRVTKVLVLQQPDLFQRINCLDFGKATEALHMALKLIKPLDGKQFAHTVIVTAPEAIENEIVGNKVIGFDHEAMRRVANGWMIEQLGDTQDLAEMRRRAISTIGQEALDSNDAIEPYLEQAAKLKGRPLHELLDRMYAIADLSLNYMRRAGAVHSIASTYNYLAKVCGELDPRLFFYKIVSPDSFILATLRANNGEFTGASKTPLDIAKEIDGKRRILLKSVLPSMAKDIALQVAKLPNQDKAHLLVIFGPNGLSSALSNQLCSGEAVKEGGAALQPVIDLDLL